jgi:Arc/MetJ family transcription regulator
MIIVADNLQFNADPWHDHADWWEAEAPRVREELSVDEATLAQAGKMFGPIGSSSVGAALQEALQARAARGEQLGAYAQGVADHIRRNVADYTDQEEANRRSLTLDGAATHIQPAAVDTNGRTVPGPQPVPFSTHPITRPQMVTQSVPSIPGR